MYRVNVQGDVVPSFQLVLIASFAVVLGGVAVDVKMEGRACYSEGFFVSERETMRVNSWPPHSDGGMKGKCCSSTVD